MSIVVTVLLTFSVSAIAAAPATLIELPAAAPTSAPRIRRAARHALDMSIVVTLLLTFSAFAIAAAPASPIELPAAAPASAPRTRHAPRETHRTCESS